MMMTRLVKAKRTMINVEKYIRYWYWTLYARIETYQLLQTTVTESQTEGCKITPTYTKNDVISIEIA